jgi:hypothetical protein
MNSYSSAVHVDEGTEIRVLGETGQTIIYVFPSGGAQLLRDGADQINDSVSQIQPRRPLDEQLIAAGLITIAQRDVALYDQQSTGLCLGDILLMRGWLNEETLSSFL